MRKCACRIVCTCMLLIIGRGMHVHSNRIVHKMLYFSPCWSLLGCPVVKGRFSHSHFDVHISYCVFTRAFFCSFSEPKPHAYFTLKWSTYKYMWGHLKEKLKSSLYKNFLLQTFYFFSLIETACTVHFKHFPFRFKISYSPEKHVF